MQLPDTEAPSLSLLRRQPMQVVLTDIEKREREGMGDEKHLFLCKMCGIPITSPSHVISVSGSHEHTFQNPAGFVFDIGCFSAAEGCVIHGMPTIEYTWFPSYAWVYAFCTGCVSHLGWFFQSASDGFFGLVLDRLIEWRAPDAAQ
ncbi:MAG: cereblon family protein [Acidobacteriota bacterium]